MTVAELIRELESMPQNVPVYVGGKLADKVIMENYRGDWLCVRILNTRDVELIDGIKDFIDGFKPQESER